MCGLSLIPDLINAGVTCLKIEGRMKSPEYVATVTRIYRKYINLAENLYANNLTSEDSDTNTLNAKKLEYKYIVEESDKKALLQVFNRGMFSHGHLESTPNRDFVCKEKPNNMGIFLGKIEKYNKSKGYITIKLQEPIEIGDTVAVEHEKGTYNVSELMKKNKNVKETSFGDLITIGRMKGNINLGDKVYKMSSKKLNEIADESINQENRKIPLNAKITIKKNMPLEINVTFENKNTSFPYNFNDTYLKPYNGLNITYTSKTIPEIARNISLNKEKVLAQINKTNDSIFEFKNVNIELDDNLFLPISSSNDLRRNILDMAYNYAVSNIKKTSINDNSNITLNANKSNELQKVQAFNSTNNFSNKKQISVLLNILNTNFDYSKLSGFDNIYIPLKYFIFKQYFEIIKELQDKFKVYIYMPTIIKANYRNLFYANIENTIKDFNISGFVISNISNLKLLEDFINKKAINNKENKLVNQSIITTKQFEIISNYTFNVFNLHTADELTKLGINRFTISPESTNGIIENLCKSTTPKELIVYGNTPLMNINYCPLGKTNKCYPTCESKCMSKNKYYLKDRLNMNFRILFDNIQTISTIYNCKTTSISSKNYDIDCERIDILDENIEEINNIVATIKNNNRFEGKEFTNGNLNREI